MVKLKGVREKGRESEEKGHEAGERLVIGGV